MLLNCLPVRPALPRAHAHGLDAISPLLHQAGYGRRPSSRPRRLGVAAGQEEGRGGRRGAPQPRGGGVAPPPTGLSGTAGKDGRPARLGHPGEAVLVASAAVEAPLAVVVVVADLALEPRPHEGLGLGG